jgi:transcriptional regulator with XRE-family HTH domain
LHVFSPPCYIRFAFGSVFIDISVRRTSFGPGKEARALNEQSLKDTLGKNIRHFRVQRGLSQADLAEKAGVSVTFVSNIERGNNYPLAGTICNLTKALNVEVWELFKGEITPDESRDVVQRLAKDAKKRVDEALDSVFRQYQG